VDDDLKESCQLDAVLCMVDAKHITQHLDEVKPEDVVNEAGGCTSNTQAATSSTARYCYGPFALL
jgi:G3E family GTPase